MLLAKKGTCTACMACVDACGHKVLKPIVNEDGYYQISVDRPKACVDCGMCTKSCPILSPINKDSDRVPTCYAAWTDEEEIRTNSASGGVFGAIAKAVILAGGVAYGAAIDGFNIVHKRVDSLESLKLIQGSKYQHSSMENVYRQVRRDLIQGLTVVFSGLSCQVAGLKRFLQHVPQDNLYTIDTICGGLATMLPMLNLEKTGKYSAINSFRDKEAGWTPRGFKYALKMERRNDGQIENLGLDNPVLNVFSSKLLKRSSCLDCKFNGINRLSDITIGDFWGNCPHKEQHNRGVSAIIIHDPRIMAILQLSHLELAETNIATIIAGNHNLNWTRYRLLRYMPMRKQALDALKNDDTNRLNRYIGSHTLPGLILRLYLKLNNIHRAISAR